MKRGRAFVNAVSIVWSTSRAVFAGAVALFAMSSLGMLALLLIGNTLLHELIEHGDGSAVTSRVWWLVFGAVAVAGLMSFAGAASAGLNKLLAEKTVRYCSEITLRLTAHVPLREFDSPKFHDRIERATKNSTMAPMLMALALPQLLGSFVGAVGLIVGLLVVNPWLVPITLLASVPMWLVSRANSADMHSFGWGNTPGDRAMQNIQGIAKGRDSAPEVRALRLAPYLVSRWQKLYDERIAGVRDLVRTFIRRSVVGSVVGALVIGSVLLVVLLFVRNGDMTIGAAATACLAVLLLANRSQGAATQLGYLMEQALYLEEFVELREWSERVEPQHKVEVTPFSRLAVETMSFSYPTQTTKALDGIDLRIDAGEVIAIVGQNGSGKTTLAKLLVGLYEPTEGTVKWDDTPVAQLTSDGGLSEAGVVFQDFGRYWFSAAENIAIGDVDRIGDQDGVLDAAREAGAHDFIARLDKGYDTPLTTELDGGADLSGGQWQRVAIARLLFRRASFVVLDEPTASLDAEAEAALFETIQGLRAGRTVVLISHRFSTVRSADRILVLHEGHLVEEGSHNELMALDGRYARMYRLQSKAYVDTPA